MRPNGKKLTRLARNLQPGDILTFRDNTLIGWDAVTTYAEVVSVEKVSPGYFSREPQVAVRLERVSSSSHSLRSNFPRPVETLYANDRYDIIRPRKVDA